MKVALVHDYLFDYGGAERVLEALHDLYPDAPLYTSFVDEKKLGIHWSKFKNWDIRQSWMTKIPLYKKIVSPLRLFAMHFFESFDLSEYDVVISSSNAYFAKAVITKSWVPHICYCHTPPRSLYGYSTMTDWQKNPVMKFVGEWINKQIKGDDFLSAQRVDFFIANSKEVQGRIKKFYNRDATVIFPPVDVPEKLVRKEAGEPYFLYASRLAFSKHPELAIEAANKMSLPLKVVGVGKMFDHLQSLARSTVEMLGEVSDEELHKLYQGAEALLYPVEDEDFGMVPVEAMGHGVPVIAHKSGGPKETIIDGKTGVFFETLTANGLVEAIEKFQTKKWDRAAIHKHALTFKKERFQKEIKQFVEKAVKEQAKLGYE